MYTFIVIIHLLVSLVLILVVLLQSGKAGDLASAFGGAGSQTAFGTRTAATFLTKATTVCAVIFMLTCLSLSIMSLQSGSTIMQDAPPVDPASTSQPATPPPAADQQAPQTEPTEASTEEPPGS